jgi:hypothetical protein
MDAKVGGYDAKRSQGDVLSSSLYPSVERPIQFSALRELLL